MTYALIDLTTAAIVEPSTDVPAALRGLPDHVLAAPAEHIVPPPEGWETRGLWRVVNAPLPEHDPAAERPEPGALVVDAEARVVRQGWTVQPLPAELRPQPRPLTKLQFVGLCQSAGGMTDEQLVAAHEDARLRALWLKLSLATAVELTDPATTAGLEAMQALGHLPDAQAVIDAWPT